LILPRQQQEKVASVPSRTNFKVLHANCLQIAII
jgi:hypothetical protein